MRLVCISDTHGLQNNFKIPDGDVLIHAGDFCNTGIERDVHEFAKWLDRLPHRWKAVIAGNHDWFFQKQPELARTYRPVNRPVIMEVDVNASKFLRVIEAPTSVNWLSRGPSSFVTGREKWKADI